jgi:hypothetical protein
VEAILNGQGAAKTVELVKQLQQQLYHLQVITATKITIVEITEEIIDGMARATTVMETKIIDGMARATTVMETETITEEIIGTIIRIGVTTTTGEMVKDGRPAQQQQQ